MVCLSRTVFLPTLGALCLASLAGCQEILYLDDDDAGKADNMLRIDPDGWIMAAKSGLEIGKGYYYPFNQLIDNPCVKHETDEQPIIVGSTPTLFMPTDSSEYGSDYASLVGNSSKSVDGYRRFVLGHSEIRVLDTKEDFQREVSRNATLGITIEGAGISLSHEASRIFKDSSTSINVLATLGYDILEVDNRPLVLTQDAEKLEGAALYRKCGLAVTGKRYPIYFNMLARVDVKSIESRAEVVTALNMGPAAGGEIGAGAVNNTEALSEVTNMEFFVTSGGFVSGDAGLSGLLGGNVDVASFSDSGMSTSSTAYGDSYAPAPGYASSISSSQTPPAFGLAIFAGLTGIAAEMKASVLAQLQNPSAAMALPLGARVKPLSELLDEAKADAYEAEKTEAEERYNQAYRVVDEGIAELEMLQRQLRAIISNPWMFRTQSQGEKPSQRLKATRDAAQVLDREIDALFPGLRAGLTACVESVDGSCQASKATIESTLSDFAKKIANQNVLLPIVVHRDAVSASDAESRCEPKFTRKEKGAGAQAGTRLPTIDELRQDFAPYVLRLTQPALTDALLKGQSVYGPSATPATRVAARGENGKSVVWVSAIGDGTWRVELDSASQGRGRAICIVQS